ncbi:MULTISPECIES: hypothetical protein [Burkholderiaceae]|uniref:hypothetical protein n=1 Tax=Burkholderiaceae TaxID=119060 RepID=UPI001EF0305B|nr:MULTISPECIES: hypothetical protein [Burkholderiaceae]
MEKRFRFQKRLAIGTGTAFLLIAAYAISRGNVLGIFTLVAGLPVMFMASLDVQFRLWQVRNRRLSEQSTAALATSCESPVGLSACSIPSSGSTRRESRHETQPPFSLPRF